MESVRFFRQDAVPEQSLSNPDWDLYVGSWLGAYVEVYVVRAAGTVADLYFEID